MKAALIVLFVASSAFGACFDGHPTVAQEYGKSLYVLSAKVLDAKTMAPSQHHYFLEGDVYEIQPLEILKGSPIKKLLVFSENSSGRFPMDKGSSYLLFLYQVHGRWSVDNCGNSVPMKDSQEVLAKLRTLRNDRNQQSAASH